MLRHAWKLWTAIVVTYGIGAVLEYFDPSGAASYWDEMLMHLAHTFTVLGVAVTGFAFVDRLLLPWLDLQAVVKGEDGWDMKSTNIRTAVIVGWCLVFAAWLVAWAMAFSGD